MFGRAIFLLALSSITASCGNQEIIPPVTTRQPPAMVNGISSDKALATANDAALKQYPSLKDFRPVVCEQQIFWRVIYDGGGPEFVVDKISGKVIWSQSIPQGQTSLNPEAKTPGRITAAKALEIAQEDMRRSRPALDLDAYVLDTCELDRVWRVIVEPKLTMGPNNEYPAIPNATTLNYVIDKSSGAILFKQRT